MPTLTPSLVGFLRLCSETPTLSLPSCSAQMSEHHPCFPRVLTLRTRSPTSPHPTLPLYNLECVL